MRKAPSLGTGYRNLTVNRDGDAGLRLIRRGTEIPAAIVPRHQSCARSWRTDMRRTCQLLARIDIAAAALTAPLAFPAPAKADPTREDVWDRVALCESGDNWRANTGNGYYGGLQFSRLTWNSFGGGAYAGTANYATRWQQITIAEKMVRAQGWGAWPTCSVKAGVR